MKNKKCNQILISILFLFLFNLSAFSQNQSKQTNAEYVLELIRTNSLTSVYMVANNHHIEYKKQWLSNISIKENFIIFREGNNFHSWNVDDLILVEKNGDVLKIRLHRNAGL